MVIKCDKIKGEWDYETCVECNNFSMTIRHGKHRLWRCKLNNKTAAEKRIFQNIWAVDYLISRGMFHEKFRDPVTVEFVGKKVKIKKERKINNMSFEISFAEKSEHHLFFLEKDKAEQTGLIGYLRGYFDKNGRAHFFCH